MTGKALKECCFRWRCWGPASRRNTTYGVPAGAGVAVASLECCELLLSPLGWLPEPAAGAEGDGGNLADHSERC